MLASLPPLPSGSRGQNIARVLRNAIGDGALLPGSRLLESELAGQFGTSNGPVREALRLLETEGLVVSAPYRGATVAEVSQEEIEEVLVPIRILIERFTFERAIELINEDDIAQLRQLIQDMRTAAVTGDADELARADLEFHELVIRRSGQHHCLQLWRVIQPRVRAYFRRDAAEHTDPQAVAGQHQVLLDALVEGDADVVDQAINEHIQIYMRR